MSNDGERKPRYLGRPKKMFGLGGGFQCWTTTNGPDIVELAERLHAMNLQVKANELSRAKADEAKAECMAGKTYRLKGRAAKIEEKKLASAARAEEQKNELLARFMDELEDWDD